MKKDAEEYGPALNAASWEFIETLAPEARQAGGGALFNNCKEAVRAAILKYLGEVEITARHPDTSAGQGLSTEVVDHCWKMYQQGQGSADHTAKEVFEQTLKSLADWLAAPAPTDLSRRLRDIRSFGPEDFALLGQAADEIDRYYGAMLAWKQTAETKDRKLSDEMRARIDERVAARIAEGSPLTQAQIDHIGEQWDDCLYVDIGGPINIGESIRAELAKIGGVK